MVAVCILQQALQEQDASTLAEIDALRSDNAQLQHYCARQRCEVEALRSALAEASHSAQHLQQQLTDACAQVARLDSHDPGLHTCQSEMDAVCSSALRAAPGALLLQMCDTFFF